MKELSIEEKAKRYDEAIERARVWKEKSGMPADRQGILDDIFPELKVSEDEEVRKALYEYFKKLKDDGDIDETWYGFSYDKILAWLEKKGEQKPTDKVKPTFKIGDWVIDKQGIVHQIANVVENVTNHTYGYDIVGGGYFNDNTEGVRLWTIQDAKDGDVISFNDGHGNDCIELIKSITNKKIEFWFCLTNGNSYEVFDGIIPYTNLASRKGAILATQEQRDTLFAKIKEAGYEWDAEKKDLKKINSYCKNHCKGYQETGKCFVDGGCKTKRDAEQNPAWSEEDLYKIENALFGTYAVDVATRLLNKIKSIKDRVQQKPAWSEDDDKYNYNIIIGVLKRQGASATSQDLQYERQINWLKSLKDRYTWKPSDEQMKLLREVQQALLGKDCHNRFVNFMYELKRLREE